MGWLSEALRRNSTVASKRRRRALGIEPERFPEIGKALAQLRDQLGELPGLCTELRTQEAVVALTHVRSQ
jgi:hypothetical protein